MNACPAIRITASRSCLRSAARWLTIGTFSLGLAAIAPSSLAQTQPEVAPLGYVQNIDHALICQVNQELDSLPGQNCAWKELRLPSAWRSHASSPVVDAWFKLKLELPTAPSHGLAIFITTFNRTGRIFVNQSEVKAIGAMSTPMPLNWNRSQYIVVPGALFHKGMNEIEIQQRQYSWDEGKLSKLLVGPEDLLRPLWERRVFWQNDVSAFVAAITSTVGIFMLFVWLMRRSEAMYFWFGLTCLIWTLLNSDYFLTYALLPDRLWEKLILASSVLHAVVIYQFILRYSGRRFPRFEPIMWVYFTIGLIGLIVHAGGGWARFWFLPPSLLMPYFSGMFARAGFRRNRTEGYLILITVSSQLFLVWYDTWLFATDPPERIFLAHYGIPLYVLIVAMTLIRHFVDSMTGFEKQQALTQRALEDSQQATKDKNLFFSMVSHELKSPLQSILAVLATEDQRSEGKERRVSLQKVGRAVRYMEAQIRDLFVLSVGEAGKLEMRSEPFEVGDLVDEVVSAVSAQAAAKAIEIDVVRPEESVFVATDPRRVEQILLNLVENAVKYTNGGIVSITYALEEDGQLRIEVTDSGIGIHPEHIEKLFLPYRRFALLEREHNSLGIGLAVVQTLLTHLGGERSVKSTPGVGSTFTVRIPVAVVKDRPSEQTCTDAVQVLIVDDRSEMLADLREVAQTLGYIVDTAGSAAEAANLLAVSVYDVVLVDLDMPVKNGYELASEIRRGDGLNKGTCLVAFSAGNPETQDLRLPDGRVRWPFDSYEQKPVDARAMKRIVETRSRHHGLEDLTPS